MKQSNERKEPSKSSLTTQVTLCLTPYLTPELLSRHYLYTRDVVFVTEYFEHMHVF